MAESNKFTYLNKSSALFIPILGSLIYKLEHFLYKRGLINYLWLSRKDNKYKNRLLSEIRTRGGNIACQSYYLVKYVKSGKSKIIADFPAPSDLKKKNKKDSRGNIMGINLVRFHYREIPQVFQ